MHPIANYNYELQQRNGEKKNFIWGKSGSFTECESALKFTYSYPKQNLVGFPITGVKAGKTVCYF